MGSGKGCSRNRMWVGICLIGIILSLGGCGREAPKPTKVPMPPIAKKPEATVPAPVQPQKPSPAPAELKPGPSPIATYAYDPKGKTDPFKPLIVEKPEMSARTPQKKIDVVSEGATPLERLSLEQLKVVAIIWNIRDSKGNLVEPRALIEDPGGKGYILAQGTSVGKKQGKVVQITSTRVIVREKDYDEQSGKIKTRDVPLKLYPDE